LKKLAKRRKEERQAGDLATLARVITQVHNLEPYFEGRFDKSNDCEYCKQTTGELRENTAKHEKECRFDEKSRDRKIAECLEMATSEAKATGGKNRSARQERNKGGREADDDEQICQERENRASPVGRQGHKDPNTKETQTDDRGLHQKQQRPQPV
jgi:hypothetical protein